VRNREKKKPPKGTASICRTRNKDLRVPPKDGRNRADKFTVEETGATRGTELLLHEKIHAGMMVSFR
jgi:hypothetical protein